MTDQKFTWKNILEVTYDRLLTGFDGERRDFRPPPVSQRGQVHRCHAVVLAVVGALVSTGGRGRAGVGRNLRGAAGQFRHRDSGELDQVPGFVRQAGMPCPGRSQIAASRHPRAALDSAVGSAVGQRGGVFVQVLSRDEQRRP